MVKEIGVSTRNWVDSDQARDYWRALVNAAHIATTYRMAERWDNIITMAINLLLLLYQFLIRFTIYQSRSHRTVFLRLSGPRSRPKIAEVPAIELPTYCSIVKT